MPASLLNDGGRVLARPALEASDLFRPPLILEFPTSPLEVTLMLTSELLRKIMTRCPASKLAEYFPFIEQAMQEFEINTPLRQAAFIAQLAHESCELKFMEEIASGAAYEGRRDLGNTQPGDGKRYKGRGPIQLTGRANYKRFGDLLGLDLVNNPQLAATPQVGFRIAGLFWKSHGLNELADQQKFQTITRRINGGLNGQADRVKYYNLAKKILTAGNGSSANAPAQPQPSPTAPASDATPYPGTPLSKGSKGAAVLSLQQRLRDLGFGLTVDGNFGPGTERSVKAFQQKRGLQSDGKVGPRTWAAVFAK